MADEQKPVEDILVEGSRVEIGKHQSIPHISIINKMRALRWHPKGLEEWSMSDWAVALAGETGELCNVVKKLNRVRDGIQGNKETPEELMANLTAEIADVYLYLDLFATRCNIELEKAIRAKFNITSEKQGFPERL